MNCGDYKQDILLLIHGELGFVDRIKVNAHMSRCANCRKTRDSLVAASRAIGIAVRAPEMAPWSPSSVARSRRIPSTRMIAGLIILLAAGAYFTATLYRRNADSCTVVLSTYKCATCCTPNTVTGSCD